MDMIGRLISALAEMDIPVTRDEVLDIVLDLTEFECACEPEYMCIAYRASTLHQKLTGQSA